MVGPSRPNAGEGVTQGMPQYWQTESWSIFTLPCLGARADSAQRDTEQDCPQRADQYRCWLNAA
jgi:hypothetical protein